MSDHAVLGRSMHIEPRANGGGKLRRLGPMHLFNGKSARNDVGRVKAWCGASVASADLNILESRRDPQPFAGDLCKRCFL